jgi:hypothetical protein
MMRLAVTVVNLLPVSMGTGSQRQLRRHRRVVIALLQAVAMRVVLTTRAAAQ